MDPSVVSITQFVQILCSLSHIGRRLLQFRVQNFLEAGEYLGRVKEIAQQLSFQYLARVSRLSDVGFG